MSDDVIVVESGVKEIQGMKHGHLVVVEGTQTHKMRVGDRLLIHPAFYIVLKKGANHAICQFEFRAIGYKQRRDKVFPLYYDWRRTGGRYESED